MKVKDAATLVYGNMKKDPKDPPQIAAVLVEILVQVIAQLILQYGPELLDKIKNMNICTKFTLSKILREKLKGTEYTGYSGRLYTSFVKTVPELTDSEILEMIREIKK